MQGSLTLHGGTLYVGFQEKTAHVSVHDLDGRRLAGGFSFRDGRLARSVVSGIAVDDDRLVWVADTPSSRVRTFSVFGSETGGLGLSLDEPLDGQVQDVAGLVRCPVDVEVEGNADGRLLWVAGSGSRRHGVQVFDGDGRLVRSLKPRGDALGRFDRIRGIARGGRYFYVAEWGGRRVQVFRDGEFHFEFAAHSASPEGFRPTAVAPLEDGRTVVACAGETSALLLCDAAGRLLRVLAESGTQEGAVFEPSDVVVEAGLEDRHTRLAVIDRDGDRVQIFTVDGHCFGAFESQAI